MYLELNPESLITYKQYTEALLAMNRAMIDHILEGNSIELGHNMGNIYIKKVQRSSSSIDWGETNKLKKKGINKYVYFTTDYWYRWYWNKKRCRVKNKTVYKFVPTKGNNGIRKQLHNKLINDPYIENIYKQ